MIQTLNVGDFCAFLPWHVNHHKCVNVVQQLQVYHMAWSYLFTTC